MAGRYVAGSTAANFLLGSTGGRWSGSTIAGPPVVDGAACRSASSCLVAIGRPTALYTEHGNGWIALLPPAPVGLPVGASFEVQALACSSTSCVAAGRDVWPASSRPAVDAWNGSSWTTSGVTLPSGARAASASISAVGCTASACTAVGEYQDRTSDVHALVVQLVGGRWTGTAAPIPTDAAHRPETAPAGLACAASSCTVTGDYVDKAGAIAGFASTRHGTRWVTAKLPMPSTAAGDLLVSAGAVACTASLCAVAGRWRDPAPAGPTLLAGSGSHWTSAVAPLPSGAGPAVAATIADVACASRAGCLAVGHYRTTTGATQGLVDSLGA